MRRNYYFGGVEPTPIHTLPVEITQMIGNTYLSQDDMARLAQTSRRMNESLSSNYMQNTTYSALEADVRRLFRDTFSYQEIPWPTDEQHYKSNFYVTRIDGNLEVKLVNRDLLPHLDLATRRLVEFTRTHPQFWERTLMKLMDIGYFTGVDEFLNLYPDTPINNPNLWTRMFDDINSNIPMTEDRMSYYGLGNQQFQERGFGPFLRYPDIWRRMAVRERELGVNMRPKMSEDRPGSGINAFYTDRRLSRAPSLVSDRSTDSSGSDYSTTSSWSSFFRDRDQTSSENESESGRSRF